jgi:hypothetical protein
LYRVGDKVVYPHHGAGTVVKKETREVLGEKREYMTIKILHNDMTVNVPSDNADRVGLRKVIDEPMVAKVLKALTGSGTTMPKNWNRRFKHNRDKIKTGDIFELAEYYPGVQNVSVVPVGLTAHRENLPEVRTLGRREARQIAHTVRRYGRAMQRSLGTEFCYVADELVLLAGLPVPGPAYYGTFSQRENGVGLVRSALMFFERAKGQGASLRRRGIRRFVRIWHRRSKPHGLDGERGF